MENETIENISGELMFTQKRYNKFKKDYNQAIESKKSHFIFYGREVLIDYAKYVLEYLKPQYEK